STSTTLERWETGSPGTQIRFNRRSIVAARLAEARLCFRPALVAREGVQFYAPAVIAAVIAPLPREECDLLMGWRRCLASFGWGRNLGGSQRARFEARIL